APAEAIESAEGRVLLVLDRPGATVVPQLLVRQADQPLEVALPEVLRRGIAAGLQVADPARDRALAVGRHGMALVAPRSTARPVIAADCNRPPTPAPAGGIRKTSGKPGRPRFFPNHEPR